MNNESQVLNVPIEDIIPNRFQPRLNFDEDSLKELAASIKEHGIIQPLVLRRIGDKYEIIAGERRYKASKLAGLTSVPAIISQYDDRKSAEVAIVENIQRKDLSPIEEAKSYKTLLDKGYLTQEELAKKMGLSQSAISNKLRLLSLSDVVQNALMTGKISERHARSLLKIENADEQNKWLNTIINERLTVKDLENKIKSINEDTKEIEDIPLIELTPSIDKIKEQAMDIEINRDILDILPQKEITEEKPIPNKFFNYLEDEEANMNMAEPTFIDIKEEIELLDFDVTALKNDNQNEEQQPVVKDMLLANNLIDKVVNDIKNSNYKVRFDKDENTNEIKYTIIVNKNE